MTTSKIEHLETSQGGSSHLFAHYLPAIPSLWFHVPPAIMTGVTFCRCYRTCNANLDRLKALVEKQS
jgi:hypothetical protein